MARLLPLNDMTYRYHKLRFQSRWSEREDSCRLKSKRLRGAGSSWGCPCWMGGLIHIPTGSRCLLAPFFKCQIRLAAPLAGCEYIFIEKRQEPSAYGWLSLSTFLICYWYQNACNTDKMEKRCTVFQGEVSSLISKKCQGEGNTFVMGLWLRLGTRGCSMGGNMKWYYSASLCWGRICVARASMNLDSEI